MSMCSVIPGTASWSPDRSKLCRGHGNNSTVAAPAAPVFMTALVSPWKDYDENLDD